MTSSATYCVRGIVNLARLRKRALLVSLSAALVFLVVASGSSLLLGQSIASGTIQGQVTDPTGAAVPRVTVGITHVETNVTNSIQSDELGRYFAPGLRVGNYSITVRQTGFKTAVRSGIILQVNQFAEVNITLALGAVTEEVTVTGAAPLVESSDATIGQVVENRQITALPLNGRSYAQLAFLTPTVVPGNGCCPQLFTPTFSTKANFSVGGTRGESTNFTVDGITATNDYVGGSYIYPSIDALQEFKIVQNSFLPEMGSRQGQVLVVSKAGTNEFHGSVYEFLRNDRLDARNTFDIDKRPLRLNQFGVAGGGPIIKDKTFWFFGYEGTRQRRGITQSTVVPSAAMRSGDLSELLPGGTQLLAPIDYPGAGLFAGDPIPGNRLDLLEAANPGALSPIASNVINLTGYPLPNAPGNTFSLAPSAPTDQDYYQARIDHDLSEKDRIWGSYYYQELRQTTTPFTTFQAEIPEFSDNAQQGGIHWSRIFQPTLVNELRLGYSRNVPRAPNTSHPDITGLSQQDLGFPLDNFQPILGQSGTAAGIPSFAITGYGAPGGIGFAGGPHQFETRHLELGDTLNYVRGSHRIVFGTQLMQDRFVSRFNPNARGTYFFNGQYTGDGFADFLLGSPNQTLREVNFVVQDIFESIDRLAQTSFFAQDTWQISPTFTLNYGFRYDYFGPATEVRGRMANVIGRGDQLVRVEGFGGQGGTLSTSGQSLGTQGFDIRDDCLCTKQAKNFSPRLSFAIRPFGDRTVLRAGAGLFISRQTYNRFQATRFNPPWIFRQQFDNTISVGAGGPGPSFDITNGFAVGVTPQTRGGIAQDPNAKDMRVQQWNFEIQQQVSSSLMASITYAGHQMYNGDASRSLNQARPGPGPLQPRRPFPGLVTAASDPVPPDPNFLAYESGHYGATSSYHAMTALVRKQYSQGLTLLAHFTWSKTIDTSSSTISGDFQNPDNIAAERGLSTFHVPRRFVASWIYELPFGTGKPFLSSRGGVVDQILGGWQITGILGFQDGVYISPSAGVNSANIDGVLSTLRADRVCDGAISNPTRDRWFDPNCFVVPGPFRYGTSGRNVLQGPGASTFDLSFIKDFHITEVHRLQFRAEFFNAFNITNLANPDNNASSGTVGRIFGTSGSALPGSREIQFALKFIF
jgi:hypothetical protein